MFIKHIELSKRTAIRVARYAQTPREMAVILASASAMLFTVAAPAVATVIDVAPNGFTLQVTAHIAAPPGKVYGVLTKPALWWDSAHTFSGDAHNLVLSA